MTSDSRWDSPVNRNRLQIVRSLLESYDGAEPFHHFIRKFFNANKGFGSTDRRLYREWSYCFFRIGKALSAEDFLIRLAVANYLVNGSEGFPFLHAGLPQLAASTPPLLQERFEVIRHLFPEFKTEDIFSFHSELSSGINRNELSASMVHQPRVFIRVNRGREKVVMEELTEKEIHFREISEMPQCISLDPMVQLQSLSTFGKGFFAVQDRSSQIAGLVVPAGKGESWWDCCCGAGGKSLQLLDRFQDLTLTASDKRMAILDEFKLRMQKKDFARVAFHSIDLETGKIPFGEKAFDGILVDAPCSGSGTWGRTPEWLCHFNENNLTDFTDRQKHILQKVVTALKPGGHLVYITCSVFHEENEAIAQWAGQHLNLHLLNSSPVSGIEFHSDSMYYAIFKKS